MIKVFDSVNLYTPKDPEFHIVKQDYLDMTGYYVIYRITFNTVNDRVNKLPDWAKNQLFGFGINLYKKPKKRRYGIEIDGQHFFIIETVDDLKRLCNFINS